MKTRKSGIGLLRNVIRNVKSKFRFKITYNDKYINEMQTSQAISDKVLEELKKQ